MFLLSGAAPAGAACRLALALALDVSKSVSLLDYGIQRDGIVAALQNPEIRKAFLKPQDKVALAIFEWSGREHQEPVLDWTMMESVADLDAVTALMAAHDRNPDRQATALGRALIFAHELIADAPDCVEQTLDVSGDGRSNDGYSPKEVYERWDFTGVTVNGLAIGGHEADIAAYYADQVIRGPGAFVMTARRHEDFPDVIRRKLLRELTDALLGGVPGQRVQRKGRALGGRRMRTWRRAEVRPCSAIRMPVRHIVT